MTTTALTDDERATRLLAPLREIPEGRAHARDLLHHLGGDPSQLLRAIHSAEAILELKGIDWKPSLHPRDRVGRFAHSRGGGSGPGEVRPERQRPGGGSSRAPDTGLPRAPLIDTRQSPDDPMKFHGLRIGRDSSVYASTTPATHGRTNPNYETSIGSVQKRGQRWVARSPGGIEFEDTTQSGAAKQLLEWAQARENSGVRRRISGQVTTSALDAPELQDSQHVTPRLRETPGDIPSKNPPRSELGALRVVYDDFAASTDVVANRLGISDAQALRLLHGLEQRNLIVGMESDDSGWVRDAGGPRARGRSGDYIHKTWQSWMTYDDHAWAEVQANARKNGVSETELKPGKTPKQQRAQRQTQRVAKPASDRQIKVVANAASFRFDPVALLKLSPEELATKLEEAKAERDHVLMRNSTFGEQSRVRSQVTNVQALQQIQGDENATRTMLGYMYDNEYKQRSPDLNMLDKPTLGRQLGKSEEQIKKGKKTDFVREAIEKEIGTREQYAARAMQTITGGG